MRILITGGAGFLGHHVVDHFMKRTDADIVVLDKLTYASKIGFDRLRDSDAYDSKRTTILAADFREPLSPGVCQEIGAVDYIIHLGGETHVDNSIGDSTPFVLSNVLGTQRILDFARTLPKLKLMIFISTDEVFGVALGDVCYKETDQCNPRNPYSATKMAAECLCMAYHNTYGVPVIRMPSMNLFGERQATEKFLPMTIRNVMQGNTVIIHASPDRKTSGSRFYIHCRNWASAAHFLLSHGVPGERYNIVGEKEVTNLELAQTIADVVGKPLHYEMVDFHSSRPGHDLRYALDGSKLAALGWAPPVGFEESLRKTILWYMENPRWLQ